MRRMRVKQPDPKVAVDLLNLVEQTRESRTTGGLDRLPWSGFFSPQIHPVKRGVLADQIELANAFRDKAADFSEHRFHRAAAMFAAHLRDHTETTGVITAFGDFYISRMRWRESKSRRVVIGNVRGPRIGERKIDIVICQHPLNDCAQLFYLVQPNEGIDFRHFFTQLARKTLRHAPANN